MYRSTTKAQPHEHVLLEPKGNGTQFHSFNKMSTTQVNPTPAMGEVHQVLACSCSEQ
jgi:hypothetical protein